MKINPKELQRIIREEVMLHEGKNPYRIQEDEAEEPISGDEPYQDLDIDEAIAHALSALKEDMSGGHAQSRNAMSRPTGYMDTRYDDLDPDESTLSEGDDEFKKQRLRKYNSIRGQLDNVWVMLGKAETKLGAAEFEAEDVHFNKIQKILGSLVEEVRGLMKKLEQARDNIA